MRTPSRCLAALGAALLTLASGCVQPPSTPDVRPAASGPLYPPPEPDPEFTWNETGRSVPLKLQIQYVYGVDVLCVSGGGPHLGRSPGHVLPETGHLDVRVRVEPGATYMGLRIGYVVDSNGAAHAASSDKPITWLPAVYNGDASFRIVVPKDSVETPDDPIRWHFYHTINPDMDDLCYTGLAKGKASVRIEAVRTGAA